MTKKNTEPLSPAQSFASQQLSIGPGKLEDDTFWINDVVLSISPTQIQVDKTSYNTEWEVMRSRRTQKAKTGHGMVAVSLDIIFEGSTDINFKMRPLVAGLRSTPFCIIRNKYLEAQLQTLPTDIEVPQRYKLFQPVALALTSMTFSTMGHANMPTCITGHFEFLWFNYFPYTPVFCFKTGEGSSTPGLPEDSSMWKNFYKPFLDGTLTISSIDRFITQKTVLGFKEFMTIAKGDSSSTQTAINLLKTIQQAPGDFFAAYEQAARDTKGVTESTFFNNIPVPPSVQITNSDNVLQQNFSGAGVGLGQHRELIFKMGQKVVNNKGEMNEIVNTYQKDIENAIAELTRRRETLEKFELLNSTLPDDKWIRLQELEPSGKFKINGDTISTGTMEIYGRNRSLTLSPDDDYVLQQVTITFQNFISVIPISGYTYPTCQYLGSQDVRVSLSVNCSNSASGGLHRVFDSIEKTNKKFRQLPQSFLNLWIMNDFLTLFGQREFVTDRISSSTIEDQPGRSFVNLSLLGAGVTLNDQLNEDTEELKQEFVMSDKQLRREVWNILAKNIAEGDDTNPAGWGTQKEGSLDGWKLRRTGIVPDGRNQSFATLIDRATSTYNKFLETAHKRIFDKGHLHDWRLFFRDVSEGEFGGFVPYLEKLHRTVADRFKILGSRKSVYNQTTERGIKQELDDKFKKFSAKDKLKQEIENRELKNKALVQPGKENGTYEEISSEQGIILSNGTPEEKYRERLEYLKDAGLFEYVDNVAKLLDDIIQRYLFLPQFEHLVSKSRQIGIGKGKPAYPDFSANIRAMASEFTQEKLTDASLLDYEPDGYLWYPAYDGSIDAASSGTLVDAELLAVAKQHSLEAFNTAKGSLNNFFQRTYLSTLEKTSTISDERKGSDPHSRLLHYLKDPNQMGVPLYDNITGSNFTFQEDVKHGFIADPSKGNVNWSAQNLQVKGLLELPNSTDYNQIVNGITGGGNDPSNNDTNESYQPPITGGKGTPAGYNAAGSGKGVVTDFIINWGTKEPSYQKPVNGYICPIAHFTKLNGLFKSREINKSSTHFNARCKGALRDYNNPSLQQKMAEAGFRYDIKTAQKEMGKSLTSWTYDEYEKWKVGIGPKGRLPPAKEKRRLAYIHKGLDVWCALGTDVYAVADGTVRFRSKASIDGAGLWVWLNHSSGPVKSSVYMHLQGIRPDLSTGESVKQGELLGVAGASGGAMGVHLHFECWGDFNRKQLLSAQDSVPWTNSRNPAKRYAPPKGSPQEKRIEGIKTEYQAKDVATTLSSPLMESIKDFESSLLTGQGQALRRAYPAFKLYFIEDDSAERPRKAFDDFYSYSCVKTIEVIKDEEIAADLCVIELTNISGILTNRKFRNEGYEYYQGSELRTTSELPRDKDGKIVEESTSRADVNTVDENPLASFILQEGTHIHLKLGCSNDPDLLESTFTGIVTSVELSETDDLIQIIAQSYAVELVQDIKGVEAPNELSTPWWSFLGFKDNASTGRVLEELMCSPEVVHFGRWSIGSSPTYNRELLTNKWQFVQNPADDNIFAPSTKQEMLAIGTGITDIFKDMAFTIYRTTIWDVFKEMELRCPNFVAAPLLFKDKFGERMTMFFGLPHYLYFHRCPTMQEQSVQQLLMDQQEKVEAAIDPAILKSQRKEEIVDVFYNRQAQNLKPKAIDDVQHSFRMKRLAEAKKAGYIRPFRQYHLLTSNNHIVANNIQTDTQNVANAIVVNYTGPSSFTMLNKASKALTGTSGAEASFTLKLDNALPDEDLRTQVITPINVVNEELAKRYACGQLVKNLRCAYRGEVIILGNPKIKPRDVCVIMDEVSDMVGPVEVRRVVHHFSKETGFITEITPGMMVSVAEWSTLSTAQAMGVVIEGLNRKILGMDRNSVGWGSKLSGWALWVMNGSMAQKIVTWTQLGQPVVMSPLTFHGKPFAGGLPLKKIPQSLWQIIFGSWYPEADLEYDNWKEEVGQRILSTIKKWTFQKTTGDFWRGFSGNTLSIE